MSTPSHRELPEFATPRGDLAPTASTLAARARDYQSTTVPVKRDSSFPAPKALPPRPLLEVFGDIVKEREAEYGSPDVHWGKVAALANILFETDFFTAERVGKLWMLDKQVRHEATPKRDSLGDIAGYADGIDRIRGRR